MINNDGDNNDGGNNDGGCDNDLGNDGQRRR